MKNMLFYHGQTTDGNRFTVAGEIFPDGDLVLGLALCSEKDQFVKSVGRSKAAGRAKGKAGTRGRCVTSLYDHDFYSKDQVENWFKDKETQAFIERVKPLNDLPTKVVMIDFSMLH